MEKEGNSAFMREEWETGLQKGQFFIKASTLLVSA